MAPVGTLNQDTFRHAHSEGLVLPLIWTVTHTECLQVCATLLFYPFCKTRLVLNTLADNPPFPLLWPL
ncbi:hypothetical protein I79_003396 [Cricetulus griseus]|uniref:Uncharacterized protein n=1 Tax=Cricetulus griseus TaxID=10029 RepID=G3GZV0_CRIGR|nr:hypothetical protein I79_003396 [Cricetulus griseus]